MNEEESHLIILDFNPIGSLMIYAIQPIGAKSQVFNNNIYWRDKELPQGHGPFTTVYYALEHYKQVVLSRPNFILQLNLVEGGISQVKSNVISMRDFKNKKK